MRWTQQGQARFGALDVGFQEVVHSALTGNSEVAKHQRFAENRMDTHKNAPLTPKGREAMVRSVTEGLLSKAAAARQFNVSAKTVAKWVERFRAEGVGGLRDRSSRPFSLPSQTPLATCATVETLRRQRYTGKQIAVEVGVSPATVSRVLRRLGLNRLSALEPAEPVRRYEREHPGELIHIDIKKLGKFNRIGHRITGDRTGQSNARGVGWEFVHGDRLLREPGRNGRACDDRQRLLLSLQSLCQGLQEAWPQAYPHQALYAEDQRQGRALHPNFAPRMGLCPSLQYLGRTRRRTAQMAAPLQLAPAPW